MIKVSSAINVSENNGNEPKHGKIVARVPGSIYKYHIQRLLQGASVLYWYEKLYS